MLACVEMRPVVGPCEGATVIRHDQDVGRSRRQPLRILSHEGHTDGVERGGYLGIVAAAEHDLAELEQAGTRATIIVEDVPVVAHLDTHLQEPVATRRRYAGDARVGIVEVAVIAAFASGGVHDAVPAHRCRAVVVARRGLPTVVTFFACGEVQIAVAAGDLRAVVVARRGLPTAVSLLPVVDDAVATRRIRAPGGGLGIGIRTTAVGGRRARLGGRVTVESVVSVPEMPGPVSPPPVESVVSVPEMPGSVSPPPVDPAIAISPASSPEQAESVEKLKTTRGGLVHAVTSRKSSSCWLSRSAHSWGRGRAFP